MKGLLGHFQILCTALWGGIKRSSAALYLLLGEISLDQWDSVQKEKPRSAVAYV